MILTGNVHLVENVGEIIGSVFARGVGGGHVNPAALYLLNNAVVGRPVDLKAALDLYALCVFPRRDNTVLIREIIQTAGASCIFEVDHKSATRKLIGVSRLDTASAVLVYREGVICIIIALCRKIVGNDSCFGCGILNGFLCKVVSTAELGVVKHRAADNSYLRSGSSDIAHGSAAELLRGEDERGGLIVITAEEDKINIIVLGNISLFARLFDRMLCLCNSPVGHCRRSVPIRRAGLYIKYSGISEREEFYILTGDKLHQANDISRVYRAITVSVARCVIILHIDARNDLHQAHNVPNVYRPVIVYITGSKSKARDTRQRSGNGHSCHCC